MVNASNSYIQTKSFSVLYKGLSKYKQSAKQEVHNVFYIKEQSCKLHGTLAKFLQYASIPKKLLLLLFFNVLPDIELLNI